MGDPDIVPDVGGLFLQHSPDKVVAFWKQRKKAMPEPCSSQRTASSPAAPTLGPCVSPPWLSSWRWWAAPMPWREPERRGEAARAGGQGWKQR